MKTPRFCAAFSVLHLSSTHFGPSGEIRTHGLMVPNQSAMCRSSGTSKCESFFPKTRKALIHLCFCTFIVPHIRRRLNDYLSVPKEKSAQIFEVCPLFVRQRKMSRTMRPAHLFIRKSQSEQLLFLRVKFLLSDNSHVKQLFILCHLLYKCFFRLLHRGLRLRFYCFKLFLAEQG